MPTAERCAHRYFLAHSLTAKEQKFLSRTPEARRRGIDVARFCHEGDVLCMKDEHERVLGFTARSQFRHFCYVHSAVFREGFGDLLYRHTLQLAVEHTIAVFLTLDANHPSCLSGRRCGARTVTLPALDQQAPDFVERIENFPPGGYFRDGNKLRSIHDTPEDRTLIFRVTPESFADATGQRVFVERQREVA